MRGSDLPLYILTVRGSLVRGLTQKQVSTRGAMKPMCKSTFDLEAS